jgi:hypothetical protein
MGVAEAKARFDSRERSVHLRVGGYEGRLYLDLADESWRAVEIDTLGWRSLWDPVARRALVTEILIVENDILAGEHLVLFSEMQVTRSYPQRLSTTR